MMEIIPAIDIISGEAVRLTGGDYAKKKIYARDPLTVAKGFASLGINRLHVVDLDGARTGHVVNLDALQRICQQTNLQVDFGGGVKSEKELIKILHAGARQVTVGTLSVKQPAEVKSWIKKYGADKIILGADVKNEKIAIQGWLEESEVNLFDFLTEYISAGIEYVICTDISKDGFLQGTALDLYKKIRTKFPTLKLIASGGVTTMQDLIQLEEMGCYGAIVGKAIYEGKLLAGELAEWSAERNDGRSKVLGH